MAWGNSGSSVCRMDYTDCENKLRSARNRATGKPIEAGLRVFDRGTHLAVHYYNTDIVRYYPDGAVEIATGYTQQCTLEKINRLAGLYISKSMVPLYDGRRTYPDRLLRIAGYVFSGVNGYIRINSNGMIDPTTVRPEEVEVIAQPELTRPLRAKAKEICTQLVLRRKLGAVSTRGRTLTMAWVLQNLDLPLEKINYDVWFVGNPHSVYKTHIFAFARAAGATKQIEFKEFP